MPIFLFIFAILFLSPVSHADSRPHPVTAHDAIIRAHMVEQWKKVLSEHRISHRKIESLDLSALSHLIPDLHAFFYHLNDNQLLGNSQNMSWMEDPVILDLMGRITVGARDFFSTPVAENGKGKPSDTQIHRLQQQAFLLLYKFDFTPLERYQLGYFFPAAAEVFLATENERKSKYEDYLKMRFPRQRGWPRTRIHIPLSLVQSAEATDYFSPIFYENLLIMNRMIVRVAHKEIRAPIMPTTCGLNLF